MHFSNVHVEASLVACYVFVCFSTLPMFRLMPIVYGISCIDLCL